MDDDGVALQATNHPLDITDAMVAAGERAYEANWKPDKTPRDMVKAVFEAMVYASPPEPDDELNEAALENALVEIELRRELSRRDWFAGQILPKLACTKLDSGHYMSPAAAANTAY